MPGFDIGAIMQPRFNVERERANTLFLRSYKNDYCLFQFHSQIEFYFITEGEMEITVGKETRLLHAGELSVAISYEPHTYRTPESSRSSVLLIPTYLVEEFMTATEGRTLASPFITDSSVAGKLFSLYESLSSDDVGRVRQIGYIYTMLGILIDEVGLVASDRMGKTELCERILFYINDNFKSPITPASISTHFGYNQSYISRYFKSSFGINISRYLTLTRLRAVVLLMSAGRHDVTYAALECGFSSMRTFYRAFREEYGVSPKEYIEMIK